MSAPNAAPAGPSQGSPTVSLLRAWWMVDRGSLLRLVGLGVALASFVWLWPSLTSVGGAPPVLRNLVLHTYVLAWLVAVSVGVRSVGSREVVTAFLLGVFLVPTLVFVPIAPVIAWIDPAMTTLAVWWVPPLEETALLAVVGLLVWRSTRRAGRRPGVLDLMILGFAVGGGYAVHEDALHGRLIASWSQGTFRGAFDGPLTWLFPTFGTDLPTGLSVYPYHAGHGALYGLAVGIVLLLVRRRPRVVWLLPLVWGYATLAHGINNRLTHGSSPLRALLGDGYVVTLLLAVAVPVLLVLEHHRRRSATFELPPLGWGALGAIARHGRGPVDVVVRSLAFGRYHRTRNAAITAAWRAPEQASPDTRGIETWARIAFRRLGVATEVTDDG